MRCMKLVLRRDRNCSKRFCLSFLSAYLFYGGLSRVLVYLWLLRILRTLCSGRLCLGLRLDPGLVRLLFLCIVLLGLGKILL